MSRKRGIRSGHRREFRVVRATTLRKLRRSQRFQRNRSEPILKESMAELEQVQALTLQVQQLTSAMVDMNKRHMQEIQQRDLQVAEMRGTLTALNTRESRMSPGRSDRRWRVNFIAQDRKYRQLWNKIDDPTKHERLRSGPSIKN